MYKRLNKNINRHVKKKQQQQQHQKKKITITITERNQANLQVLILCWLHWVYYNEADGRQRSSSTQSTKYMRGPLISAGEGGGAVTKVCFEHG